MFGKVDINSSRSLHGSHSLRSNEELRSPSYKSLQKFHKCHKDRVLSETAPKTKVAKIIESHEVVVFNLDVINKIAQAASVLPHVIATTMGTIGSAVVSGALGLSKGIYMLSAMPSQLYKDYQCKNGEGGLQHSGRGLMGAGYATFGGATILSMAASYAGSAALAAEAATAVTVGGFVLYGASAACSIYGIAANHLFRNKLNRMMQGNDAKSLHATLSWLQKETLGLSKKELHRKWDRLAFRTSEAVCRHVRESVTPELLEGIRSRDPQAITKANFILGEIKRENSKQLLKHYLFAVAAIIGIGAAIAGMIFAGPLAPFLSILGVLIWVTIDASHVDQKLGNLFFGESKIPPAKLPALEDKKPLTAQKNH